MDTKKFLLVFCFALAALCSLHAQTNEEDGWFNAGGDLSEIVPISVGDTNEFEAEGRLSGIVGDSIAEAVTPEIEALARGLESDPKKIFDYVHDHIRYVHYFGSKKGAQLTLLEGSGNEFDQCALLISLLRVAGFTNAVYQFGGQKVPYESTDHRDFRHWQGLSMPNTNWNTTYTLAWYFNQNRGYPGVYDFGDNTSFALHRLWVKLPWNGTNYFLDPVFHVNEPTTGVDLIAATGMSSNAIWTAAGGTVTANSIASLAESTLRNKLRDYTTNLVSYLQSNAPNASVEEVLGGWQPIATNSQTLATGTTWPVINSFNFPTTEWVNIPTNWMSKMTVTFGNSNLAFYLPELMGRRLALVFTNGQSQLWVDDESVLQRTNVLTSGQVNVTMSIDHPHNDYSPQTATWFDRTRNDQTKSALYRTNGVYAIIYAYEAGPAQLRKRQAKLDAYRQQGLADSSREVMSETLNVLGLNWLLQTEMAERLLTIQTASSPQYHHRFGRMAYEPSFGYYVDVYLQFSGIFNTTGITAQDSDRSQRAFELSAYFQSAMEHGVIEQLQSSNLVAASTIKMLQLASTNSTTIYLLTSNNWSSISGSLANYNLSYLQGLVNTGHRLLLPQNGQIQIAGSGSWKGYGIVDKSTATDNTSMAMLISGGYQGGYSAYSYSAPSPSYISSWSYSSPSYFNVAPPSLPFFTGADPVNMVDGSFTVNEPDLVVGQADPRGLSLARSYSSSRRFHNLAAVGEGWTHNYFINLSEVSAPQAALGDTTPAQMASMLVATRAAVELYPTTNNVKNWATTALVAKWGVDQIRSNAVSITLGNDTVQFVKQPDGKLTPPAGSTMALLQTNSIYWLLERNGKTFKFDSTGRLTNLVDQYNQTLTVSYLAATSSLPQTITDWKGRSLTLTYSGTPQRLASVSTSTGQGVSFGYTTNSGRLDLTSVTDPENQTHTFLYDTNHQIISTKDAMNRVVTTNVYDGFGRVIRQYSEGDTNKVWLLFWSDCVNVEQNPVGSKRRYYYDSHHRNTAMEDALGGISRTFYDGQDHTVATVSALNETNRFEYDGRHNLLRSIDSLGFTNQFFFDGFDRLIRNEDARGVTNWFGYNAQHSLAGSTNGAGDWVKFTYNADGTMTNRSDIGGTTSFGYDVYGLLSSVTNLNGLGGETFLNHPSGDVTNHTNARGFVTVFQYNQRRQLTNTIAPTNVTTKVAYDAVGNVSSTIDARGFARGNTWSATRKLITTTLPGTPQGTPVLTNVYDSRDWLIRTLAPLRSVNYTNDVAGRVVVIQDSLNRISRFGFNANGRQICATNAGQQVTRQTWNARGELVQTTTPQLSTIGHKLDGSGNQVAFTNRAGKVWQFQFDSANRLTNTISPRTSETWIGYDGRGLVSTVREPSAQAATNFYDAKGRVTNITDSVGIRWFSYDANDNLTGITNVGQALRISQSFDAYDRMAAFTNSEGYGIQYRYDPNGNLTNLVYPGNRVVTYAYDSLNRLTNVTDWANRKTIFTYDLANRITSIIRSNGTVRTIGYDAGGQTTNIIEKLANGAPIAFFGLNWNSNGTIQSELSAPLSHASTLPSRTLTFDDDNRVLTCNNSNVVHDADGNMTSGPLTNGSFATYTYDARNRLVGTVATTSVSYGYDPAGNRVAVTNGAEVTRFVINPNAPLSQVLMRIKGSVTNYYVYGLGLLYEITETANSTNTANYHFDYRGNTVALTDGNGIPTDRFEYSVYGTVSFRVGNNDTPFLYNGRYGVQTDPNGLLYMRARYYNPFLCRFTSADPSGFSGGLNFYAFADGNPVSMSDPFGLGAVGDFGSSSWVREEAIQSAISWGESIKQDMQFRPVLAGLANLVTFGLAGDVSVATTGFDLYGSQVYSGRERAAAAVTVAASFFPVGRIEAAATRLTTSTAERLSAAIAGTRAPTQVAFGSDISSWAQTLRYTTQNWNPVGNVAVFEFTDAAGNLQYSMGFAQRTIAHAEQVVGPDLISQGFSPSSVTRIYTEFAPCTGPANCSAYLRQTFPNAEVLYSFTHDASGRAAKASLFSTFP